MDDGRSSDDIGLLPAIAVCTLFVFCLVWGALHDIAHGETDTALEYAVLIASVPAFAFVYRIALLHLPSKARVVWLSGTGLVVLLFNLSAVNAKLYPRYALDPMLASLFLAAGVPVLGLIAYHLTRETIRGRVTPS